MQNYLDIKDLTLSAGGREILSGVNLRVEGGEMTVVLGPSGAGKTTLLRAVAGLVRPDRGTIEAAGRVWLGGDVWVAPHSRRVGFIFQDLALWPHLTAGEHIALAFADKKVGREKAAELLERFGLADKGGRYPSSLSGGEKQRLALARAVARDPEVLLMDEPFSGLDWRLKKAAMQYVRELNRDKKYTVLLVTHDQLEARDLADKVAVMNRGALLAHGPLRDLTARDAHPFVRDFLAPIRDEG